MFSGTQTVNHLLLQYCSEHHFPKTIIHHQATRSAEETQLALEQSNSPLRKHLIVQKTITASTQSGIFLVTGIGNYRFSGEDKRKIWDMLGRREDITLNAAGADPLTLFNKERGEVTPFLPSDAYTYLSYLYLCDLDTRHSHVAISLSLYESLCLEKAHFLALRHWYLTNFSGLPLLNRPELSVAHD